MDKKGMSLVVASVLLTLLAVLLAVMVYNGMQYKTIQLAPEPELDCYGLDFEAEIIREPSVDYLEVINLGNLEIGGFYIKRFWEGEWYMYEEIVRVIGPRQEDRIVVEQDYFSGRYLIVPRVNGEDPEGKSYLRPCKDIYGVEVVLE